MAMSEARSVAVAASLHLDEPVPLHPYNVFECGDQCDGEHAEPI